MTSSRNNVISVTFINRAVNVGGLVELGSARLGSAAEHA